MILLELKQYIKKHQQVRFIDIKNHFDLSDSAASSLLTPLIRQGFVQEITVNSCSTGSCSTGCVHNSNGSTYQWLDKPIKALSIPLHII